MSAKGKGPHVEALLALIDLEGDFPSNGQRWLKADQPTIAAKIGCSVRTLQTTIKNPAFVTHRTRFGGKNFTLVRRADPASPQIGHSKSASPQSKSASPRSKSASPQSKSAKTDATFEQEVRREELRQIWLAHQFKFSTDRVTKREYGLLLELAKLGITPDEFRYVVDHWMEFLACVNAICFDEATGNSKLKAYRPKPWLGTMVEFHEALKEVYLTHQQWQATQVKKCEIDKLAKEL
jgi:hypothetical protein